MRPILTIVATLLLAAGLISCSRATPPSGSSGPSAAVKPVEKSDNPAPTPPPTPKPAPPQSTSTESSGHKQHKRASNPTRGDESPVPAPSPAPPTDDQLLDSALKHLQQGNLAYSTPQKMSTGKTAHVVARIAPGSVSVEVLESGLPHDQGQKIETAATPVSTKMKMSLKGADFDITPLSSEEQFVAGTTPTQWEWDIVPKHAGKLRLHLAATVELASLSRDFTSIDRDVAVQVDPVGAITGFLSSNWQWLIATLTAIVGAAWKYFNNRKNNAAGAPPGKPA